MKRDEGQFEEPWAGTGGAPSAPHDPQLESLLDEALGLESLPGGVPAGLAQRIVARTRRGVLRRRSVLGRIEPGWFAAAVAAVVVVAVSLGAFSDARDRHRQANTLAALSRDLDALKRYAGPRDGIDEDMALLAMRIDLARTRGTWEAHDVTADQPGDWDAEPDPTSMDHLF